MTHPPHQGTVQDLRGTGNSHPEFRLFHEFSKGVVLC